MVIIFVPPTREKSDFFPGFWVMKYGAVDYSFERVWPQEVVRSRVMAVPCFVQSESDRRPCKRSLLVFTGLLTPYLLKNATLARSCFFVNRSSGLCFCFEGFGIRKPVSAFSGNAAGDVPMKMPLVGVPR